MSDSEPLPQPAVISITGALAIGIQLAAYLFTIFVLKEKGDQFYDFFGCIGFLGQLLYLLLTYVPDLEVKQYLVLGCLAVWCLRLGIFLFIRAKLFKGDSRFDEIKKNKLKFAVAYILQAVWNFITILPGIYFVTIPHEDIEPQWGFLSILGIFTYLFGLILETGSDFQKLHFKLNPINKGRFIQSGFWKYNRHPNYLGEFIIHFGLYFFCAADFSGFEYCLVGCPIFIVILITFISGVPKLEEGADKRWGGEEEYQEYKKRSGVLCFGFL